MGQFRDDAVIIEFNRQGNYLKVTAMDPVTLVEVSTFGPVSAGQDTLRRQVIRKLHYVLSKRRANAAESTPRPRQRGIIV